MEHHAPLPCDACNYGTYTPFSQQGGTSFPQIVLMPQSPTRSDCPAHHSLVPVGSGRMIARRPWRTLL